MIAPETEILIKCDGEELLRRTLRPGEYIIGRGAGNDLCVISNTVSRRHARLTVNFSNLFLEDLGSFNGTTVNGGRISGKTQIWHGQQIHIGSVSVELRKICTTLEGGSLAPAQEAVLESLPEDVTFQHNGYKIGQLIGRGGMGAVLQAEDSSIQRQIAMKVVIHGDSPKDVLRFIHEARITGRLEHPNIVPIHTLGADEHGQPFYTMKLVRGSTLKQILNGLARGEEDAIRHYPLSSLLELFQKVCDAIRFAHSQKVIHRDLKPDNIMTGDYGEVLVMDWGLAKSKAEKDDADSERTLSPDEEPPDDYDPHADVNTHTGAILGTPQYMPPEQATGDLQSIDERADIYSLGAILYHILTLRPPIEAGSTEQMLGKVIRGEITKPTKVIEEETIKVPLHSAESESGEDTSLLTPEQNTGHLPHLPAGRIPASLEAIVLKAMAREQQDRYATVDELQKDIAAYRGGFATEAEHAGFFKRARLFINRNKVISIASAVVITVCGGFAYGITKEVERSSQAISRLRKAAPTFVERAWVYLGEGRLHEALDKVDFAVEVDPKNADYHMLRARLLQAQLKIDDATEAFEAVTKLRKDPVAEENIALCASLSSLPKEAGQLPVGAKVKMLHALLRQGRRTDAIQIINELKSSAEETQRLLEQRLSALQGWDPKRLQATPEGTFNLDLSSLRFESLKDLEHMPISELKLNGCASSLNSESLQSLKDIPVHSLNLRSCNVKDLGFLSSHSIEVLVLANNPCADLSPLTGNPLRKLNLRDTSVEDLSPLTAFPQLEEIVLPKKAGVLEPLRSLVSLKRVSRNELPNGSPDLGAADFWKRVQTDEQKAASQK